MADIYLHKLGYNSQETANAKVLAELFNNNLTDIEGKIWIIPSIDLHESTGRHDIDILVLGYLKDYYLDIGDYNDIEIRSFCSTLELKSHNAEGIEQNGTRLYVKYDDSSDDVTKQSEDQKNLLRSFLSRNLPDSGLSSPFITNLIWLTGVDNDDFNNYFSLQNSNILTCDVTVNSFFEAIGRQFKLRDQGFINAFKGYTERQIEMMANLFCAKSNGSDTMSLRKLNALQQQNNVVLDIDRLTDPIIVLSGHAGTGKTIMLLQAAEYLIRKGKKCLFVTYNKALISDIKHTLSFLPGNHLSALTFQTMHGFIIQFLAKAGLWNKQKDISQDFQSAVTSFIRIMHTKEYTIDYDYVFVDEAQDWEKQMADVIIYICRKAHIVIADGVDQFMSSSEHADWGLPTYPKLKVCLRQRRNLTLFIKQFAAKLGVYWDVDPNQKLNGGKVLITNKFNDTVYRKILNDTKTHFCKEYDIMFLAPRSLSKDGYFSLNEKYKNLGIHVFDGIVQEKRSMVYAKENSDNHECRVYTYESCRGLEAWTTICLRFNEIFSLPHSHDYHDIIYSPARNYMLALWTLIPLTRAVDTIVIAFNKIANATPEQASMDNKIEGILKELADENPDFVEINLQ